MRIIATEGTNAVCEGRGRRERVDLALVDDPPAGAWILSWRGTAIRIMTATEAAATSAALDALEAVMAGEANVDLHFADLVDREPALPPHLAGRKS
jgi:hydrogenase expression/formation protein HypC